MPKIHPRLKKHSSSSDWYISLYIYIYFTAKEATRETTRALSPLITSCLFNLFFSSFFARMRLYAQRSGCKTTRRAETRQFHRVNQRVTVFQNDNNTSMKATERSLKKRGREIKTWGLKRETHTTKQQTRRRSRSCCAQQYYLFIYHKMFKF